MTYEIKNFNLIRNETDPWQNEEGLKAMVESHSSLIIALVPRRGFVLSFSFSFSLPLPLSLFPWALYFSRYRRRLASGMDERPSFFGGALPEFHSYQRTTYFKHLTHRVPCPLPLAHCREAHWPEIRTPLREPTFVPPGYALFAHFSLIASRKYRSSPLSLFLFLYLCAKNVEQLFKTIWKVVSLIAAELKMYAVLLKQKECIVFRGKEPLLLSCWKHIFPQIIIPQVNFKIYITTHNNNIILRLNLSSYILFVKHWYINVLILNLCTICMKSKLWKPEIIIESKIISNPLGFICEVNYYRSGIKIFLLVKDYRQNPRSLSNHNSSIIWLSAPRIIFFPQTIAEPRLEVRN